MRSSFFVPAFWFWAWARLALAFSFLVVGVGATCGAHTNEQLSPAQESGRKEVLGAGDVIELRVLGEPDLSGIYQVSPEGAIHLHLVGAVVVTGLSLDELRSRIELAYNEKYLKNADITLTVKESQSRKVYVLGQVGKPGPYAFDGNMSIIDAIARAGGTLKSADANRTKLTRKQGDQMISVVIRVSEIERGQEPNVMLLPGDIILVPESPL